MPPILNKKIMRLPLWVWLALAAVGLFIAYKMRQASAGLPDEENLEGLDEDELVLPTKPFESGGPLTGGGAPLSPVPVIIVGNPCRSTKCPKGFKKQSRGDRCVCVRVQRKQRRPRPRRRGRRVPPPRNRRRRVTPQPTAAARKRTPAKRGN